MTKLGPYEVHPFADAFPLIDGDEFDSLVGSIKRNGLRKPILLNHDKTVLIDGRNRYRACEAATVDPVFDVLPERYTEPMVLDLILDLNLDRRHLNAGQRAMVAVAYKEAIEKAQPKGGRPIGGNAEVTLSPNVTKPGTDPSPVSSQNVAAKSRDDRKSAHRAAKMTGASGTGVKQAAAVQRDAPDLAKKVVNGEMALDAADRERKRRLEEQRRREPEPARPQPRAPERPMLTLYTHDGKPVAYPEPQGRPTFNNTSGPGISWAQWSWNPVTGCLHGCDYCYAREIATSDRYRQAYPVGFTPLFHPERLDAPINTRVPAGYRDDPSWRRVFVCSMADLYGRWVPDEWVAQVHAAMLRSPEWQYITLTKFPTRYVGLDMPAGAWVGTTVDEQKRVRIAEDAFRQIDGVAVKWLSLEPLRERLEFADLSMFDWVVIGAQTPTVQPSGPVPMIQPDWRWVLDITQQAREAGCRIHWKPNLRQNPGMTWPDEYPESTLPASVDLFSP